MEHYILASKNGEETQIPIIPLKEIYSVDTISQDKGWNKIYNWLCDNVIGVSNEAVDGDKEKYDKVMIDFTGITVIEPWTMGDFKRILMFENVFMKFVNAKDIASRIKAAMTIDGLDDSRIISVEKEVQVQKSAEEKKVEKYGANLVAFFDVSEDEPEKASFIVKKKYSQLQNTDTIDYMRFAMNKMADENGIKRFYIDMDGVEALNNVLQSLAKLTVDMDKRGVEVDINITNANDAKSMSLFMYKMSEIKDPKERLKIVREFCEKHKYMPGKLIRYKSSRALDDFGREGNGEPIMARIAIIVGIKGRSIKVRTFNNNKFYTKWHWQVEHDMEELKELQSDIMSIDIMDLGFLDSFLGSKFHFIDAVQRDKSETSKVIYDITETGGNVSKICTLPERMKIVFDDWGVKYDEEMLNKAIEESK